MASTNLWHWSWTSIFALKSHPLCLFPCSKLSLYLMYVNIVPRRIFISAEKLYIRELFHLHSGMYISKPSSHNLKERNNFHDFFGNVTEGRNCWARADLWKNTSVLEHCLHKEVSLLGTPVTLEDVDKDLQFKLLRNALCS